MGTVENVTELTEMYRCSMSRKAGMRRFLLPGGKTSFEPFVGMNDQRVLVCRSVLMSKKVFIGREESIYDGGTTTTQERFIRVMARQLLQLGYRVKEKRAEN